MTVHTIDEVIEQLDFVIARSILEKSRLGFFAVLYRGVTIKVKEGINAGHFDDGPRMEQFDVVFANRYLEALERYCGQDKPSESWLAAFHAAKAWRLLILQHLLLGINAHINVDLGVAAAQTCPGEKLPALKEDFNKINDILSELLDVVQDKIAKASPLMGLLDRIGGRSDEAIIKFSMERARDAAWHAAEKLAPLSRQQQVLEIAELDRRIVSMARRVRNPGKFLTIATMLIKLAEDKNVPRIISALS